MMKPKSLRQTHTAWLTAGAAILLAGATAVFAAGGVDRDAAAATLLGVVRAGTDGASVVSIDFDVPRYGPLCISVDEDDGLEFVWEEYHNLYQLPDEASFEDCDFSAAVALAPEGSPMPQGYKIEAAEIPDNNPQTDKTTRYFACSKICSSKGHKVKVCAGGSFGSANGCGIGSGFDMTGCSPDRIIDIRSMASVATQGKQPSRDYVPVGKVCRPKNGDGYSITSGVDTEESCRRKCDEDSSRCGAWEFEDHHFDDKECELHEINVVSYNETLAMGDCETTAGEDYRCCWIAREVVEAQTGSTPEIDAVALSTSSAPFGWSKIIPCSIATIVILLVSGGI